MMCLAIPARISAIEGDYATVDIDGVRKEVCMALIEAVAVGEYVIVHAGFAIAKLELEEARKTLEVFQRKI